MGSFELTKDFADGAKIFFYVIGKELGAGILAFKLDDKYQLILYFLYISQE